MMDSLQQMWHRFASLFRKRPLDNDLEAEIASHLELAIEENLKRGMSVEEARHQAMLRFGGVQQAKEIHRQTRGLPLLDIFFQDLRYTFRTLRNDVGFALIAVLILAIGIGANVAVFSVVNAMLLRPLPFKNSGQLVWLAGNRGQGGLSAQTYTVDVYEEFQRTNKSFESVTSFQTFYNSIDYKLITKDQPKPVVGIQVADNFFQTLGIEPLQGRFFNTQEFQKGGPPAALLSYPFWKQQFGADSSIVGKAITLNDQAVTVVGILPEDFDFGAVFSPGMKVDFYVPAVMDFWRTWGNTLAVFGRLKPGVTVAQAQAEADVLFPQLKVLHPNWEEYDSKLSTLKDYVSGKLSRSLVVLWCAVGLILLIVCVNLSNLLLVRASRRSKEFAMRSALGARRGRIIGQLLIESLVLSGAGALLGLIFAYAVITYLAHQGSIVLPLLSRVQLDYQALGWTVAIAATTAVLVGLVPAFRMSGKDLQESLKDSGQGLSAGRGHDRLRSVLVISEVALACVLLVGAGLLLRSFLQVMKQDLGFEPSRAAAIKIDYDDGHDKPEKRAPIIQEILRKVSVLPGIESAAVVDMLPLDRNRSWGFRAKGHTYPRGFAYASFVYIVSPGYFKTMGMHLKDGRDFTWADDSNHEVAVILNRAAARHYFGSEDPIGKLGSIGRGDVRVVGVIDDVRESSMEENASPQMYLPIMQASPEGSELVVRTMLPPSALSSSVMGKLRELNPAQPATEFRPMQQLVDHAISPRRFFVALVTLFATLGLSLASLGIYGVISYSVARKTQEIGIRMALGATRSRVQAGVLGSTLRLALTGVLLGTAASWLVARAITSLLFATKPTDPLTFGTMIVLLIMVAFVAGYIPALRASRVDPMVALRNN